MIFVIRQKPTTLTMTIYNILSTNLWKHCKKCGCHYLGSNCYGLRVRSHFEILTISLEGKITNKPSKMRLHRQVFFDFSTNSNFQVSQYQNTHGCNVNYNPQLKTVTYVNCILIFFIFFVRSQSDTLSFFLKRNASICCRNIMDTLVNIKIHN